MGKKKDKKGKGETVHCFDCDQICCRTAVIEVDPPKSFRDYSDFLFYLYHENTQVVVVKSKKKLEWFVEFMTACRHLVDGRCAVYEHRPLVCREYDMDGCERNPKNRFIYLKRPEDYLKFLKKHGKTRFLKKLKKTHRFLETAEEETPAPPVKARRLARTAAGD